MTPRRIFPTTAVLATLAVAPACTYFGGDSTVLVTSTPPGAKIFLDGDDTGRTTPARLDLGGIVGSDHEITLAKKGFEAESRTVYHYTTGSTSRWIDGAVEDTWTLPLWWTLPEFIMPFQMRWRYVPHEVHARLYPEGEAPKREP